MAELRFKNDKAPAFLGHLDITLMTRTDGTLTRIDYENTAIYTGNYEVLTYNVSSDLEGIAHYINNVLIGNTVFTYITGDLSSVVYTEV